MTLFSPDQPKPARIEVDDVANREEDVSPPDGGYGWVCVGACFTINCFTWGTVSVSTRSHPERFALLIWSGLWHLYLPLPGQRCLPGSDIVGLCIHRRLQFLHRNACCAPCHRFISQNRDPQDHVHQCAPAVQWFRCCILRCQNMAVASIARRPYRWRYRLSLHPKPSDLVPVVCEETECG